jgi:hypothetical protein
MHEITPDAKVGAILERYPQVEEALIALAGVRRLRNPVLLKTVAWVAILRQTAQAGGVPSAI